MRKTTHYILLLLAALTVQTTVTFAQSSRAIGEAFLQTLLEARNKLMLTDSLENHLIEKYHKDPTVLTELGRAFYRTGEKEKARNIYDRVLALNPNFARALVGCGDIFRYENSIALKSGNYNIVSEAYQAHQDSAHYYYMKAIEAEPANQLAYDSIMVLFAENRERYYKKHTHEDSLKAAKTYETSITLLNQMKQNDPTAFVEPDMARIYMLMGKPSMAIELYQPILDKLSSAQYFNYCICLYSANRYDDAIEAASTGIKKYPGYKDFYHPILYAQTEKKLYREAVETYKEVLKLEKLYARDHTYAIDCYLHLNDVAEATRAADRIYATDDENTLKAAGLIGRTITRKSNTYENLQEYDKAADVYLKYMETRDYDKAEEFYNTRTGNKTTKEKLMSVDMYNWALEYYKKVSDQYLEQEEKDKGVEQCAEAFEALQEKFPNYNVEEATYIRAGVLAMIDDKEKFANSRALSFYEKLVSLSAAGNQVSNSHLSKAYFYLTYYWLIIKNNKVKGMDNYNKYKSLNPDDTTFDSMVNFKYASRRRR